jgi:hypothetical protein
MDFDQFKTIELQQFIYHRMVVDNKTCEKKIQDNETILQRLTMENKVEWIPEMILYLRKFYQISRSSLENDYLDERISYYELLLTFTKEVMMKPNIPKNKLRRRNIPSNQTGI